MSKRLLQKFLIKLSILYAGFFDGKGLSETGSPFSAMYRLNF